MREWVVDVNHGLVILLQYFNGSRNV